MKREVDPKRTRKAMRRLRRLAEAQSAKPPGEEGAAPSPDLSGWETEFIQEVGARLERYGSAFANLSKGRAEEALSNLQAVKLREIEAKAKGKKPRGFARRKPASRNPRPVDN